MHAYEPADGYDISLYVWIYKRFFLIKYLFHRSDVTMIIVYLLWEHHFTTIAKTITINFQSTNAFIIQILCIRNTCNYYAFFIIWVFFVNAILEKIIVTHFVTTHIVVVVIVDDVFRVVVHILIDKITEMMVINTVNWWDWLHFLKLNFITTID